MRLLRPLTVFAAALLAVTFAAHAKDLRASFVRLVPEQDWKPEAGQAIAINVTNQSDHEKSGEFATALTSELTEQLGKVLGYKIDPNAATKITFTVIEFDPGNAGMRLGLGFGGKSYVGGSIAVRDHDKEVGSLLFSVRPNLAGAGPMAREAASGVALKLSNGERDEELHPMKTKKKD
jgi:hypothetical protein